MSTRLRRWREDFGEISRFCSAIVEEMGLPKGERRRAFLTCVEEVAKAVSHGRPLATISVKEIERSLEERVA